jgi:hypothetical protein
VLSAGWDPAWDDAARRLATEALAAPVPPLEEAGWSGRGPYFRFAGEGEWYGGDTGETAEDVWPFAVDVRRRGIVRRLAEDLGHPPEVVELAWYLLPYQSPQLREGWEAWQRKRSAGQRRAHRLDLFEERRRFNYA